MKYFLILFSLFLFASCGESEKEMRQRKQRERIETIKAEAKAEANVKEPTSKSIEAAVNDWVDTTTEVLETINNRINDNEPIKVVGLKKSDFKWTKYKMISDNVLRINNKFTLVAKPHNENTDIIYSLYLNDVYAGNWGLHSEFKDKDDPIEAIIEHVLKHYQVDHVGEMEAFKFN